MKQKILKIKVGEAYIDGKTVGVYQTAWPSKDGTYYEVKQSISVKEIDKPDTTAIKVEKITL